MNRRWHERYPRHKVSGEAIVRSDEASVVCELVDISVGDALLAPVGGAVLAPVAGTPRPGEHAQVVVELSFGHPVDETFVIDATVRHRGDRMAVVFRAISDDLEHAIGDVLLAALEEHRRPRVLVVDPHDGRRQRLAASLRQAGCVPVETTTPLGAIVALAAQPAPPTGAAVAASLTQTTGRELLDHISSDHPGVNVRLVDGEGLAADPRALRSALAPFAVLVVDDDPDLRWMMVELIRRAGYGADGACDGADALRVLREHPARYDVIVLDLSMPRLDGRQFRAAQQRDPTIASIPVILASAEPEARFRGLDVAQILRKPVAAPALLAAVESCVAPRRAASPPVAR